MKLLLKNVATIALSAVLSATLVVGYLQFKPPATVTVNTISASPAAYLTSSAVTGADDVSAIYKRVGPAVVNITSIALTYDFFQRVMPQEGTGSGFVVSDRGYILTNNHVVEKADRLEVTMADGTKLAAKVVGRDPSNDLAVIKVDVLPEKLTVALLGDSDALQVGEPAIAIGNPFGPEWTATTGIINSLGLAIVPHRRVPRWNGGSP